MSSAASKYAAVTVVYRSSNCSNSWLNIPQISNSFAFSSQTKLTRYKGQLHNLPVTRLYCFKQLLESLTQCPAALEFPCCLMPYRACQIWRSNPEPSCRSRASFQQSSAVQLISWLDPPSETPLSLDYAWPPTLTELRSTMTYVWWCYAPVSIPLGFLFRYPFAISCSWS